MTNLVITGFMGTGKTTVGRQVARLLARRFVDMDSEIEKRAGKPISRIFAEDGEATFRQLEATLCRELSTSQGLVIATGGGTLVDPQNRRRILESANVVCLICGPERLLERLDRPHHAKRPLLEVPDPRAEIDRLLQERHEAYRAIPWQIDTTDLAVEEVAEQVATIDSAVTLPVRHPDGVYPIHVGRGLLAHVGGALAAAGVPQESRVAVVSNPVVAPLYGEAVEHSLRTAGLRPFACSMPDGEAHKTLPTVAGLYDQFLAGGLDRSGTVLSLGGGVTGDVAGFAAATFMRGVRFAQVPTTVLAMVDASVGGKTGVDLPQGKNLAGAFKQPVMVLIDPTVLSTLAEEEIRSGTVEVIKHGVLAGPDLFAALQDGGDPSAWWQDQGSAWIARSLRVKIDVVESDPLERGRRAVLNLGHTVGHALERLTGFALRHGEAVGIGMIAAARIAAELGRADPSLVDRITAALETWGLPVRCPPLEVESIWAAMAHDKKKQGRGLRWVLPLDIGRVEITDEVAPEIVRRVLRAMGAQEENLD